MTSNIAVAIIAFVAIGLFGIAAIETITMQEQQAAAAKAIVSQCASALKNASAQLCQSLR